MTSLRLYVFKILNGAGKVGISFLKLRLVGTEFNYVLTPCNLTARVGRSNKTFEYLWSLWPTLFYNLSKTPKPFRNNQKFNSQNNKAYGHIFSLSCSSTVFLNLWAPRHSQVSHFFFHWRFRQWLIHCRVGESSWYRDYFILHPYSAEDQVGHENPK